MPHTGDRLEIEEKELGCALEVHDACIRFLAGNLLCGCHVGAADYRHPLQHVVPGVQRLRHEAKLQNEQQSEHQRSEPLDPCRADEIHEAPDDRSDQQTGIDCQNPQSEFLTPFVLEEHVSNGGHAYGCGGADTEALDEPSSHVATVAFCAASTYGGCECYDGAGYEDDAPAVDVCKTGPE